MKAKSSLVDIERAKKIIEEVTPVIQEACKRDEIYRHPKAARLRHSCTNTENLLRKLKNKMEKLIEEANSLINS